MLCKNKKAQSKSSIRDGVQVQVLRSSSTDYRHNRLAGINLDEEGLVEDSKGAIQSGLLVLESSATVHHCNRSVVDEALLEGSS
jgi:hypothetical protein